MDMRRVVGWKTLADPTIAENGLFETVSSMETPSVQESHFLERVSNFVVWTLILWNSLKMADLWYLVEKVVVPLKDPKDEEEHNKKAMTAKQILLDFVI